MKTDKDIYENWLEEKSHVPVPSGFSTRVMAEIRKVQPARKKKQYKRSIGIEELFRLAFLRVALASGLGILGIVRFGSVIGAFVP